MPPKVSILLPNYNNRSYLDERIKSIEGQTLLDWELIVVDSHSQDGAWEYFQDCARRNKRIKIFQSKERGIYNNFNNCIRLAQGEYVYFATSDDTMFPNALEEMVQALENNSSCDLAHCKLRIIDQDNNLSDEKLWDNFFMVSYFGELINQSHIRKAPHDGVLHFSGITVYTSLTQLMIRRSLFDRIGLFREDSGSIADFEWVMRATLITNTVHVPDYLATWRVHQNQATSTRMLEKAKAAGEFINMADQAVRIARKLNPTAMEKLDIKKLKLIMKKEQFFYLLKLNEKKYNKYWIFMKWLFCNPRIPLLYIKTVQEKKNFVSQPDFLEYIKLMILEHHLSNHLYEI